MDDADIDERSSDATIGVKVGEVVETLIENLRDDSIPPRDRQLLSDELLLDHRSTDSPLTTVENRISDLSRYNADLAAFLDTWGSAEELLDTLRDDVSRLESEVTDELPEIRGELSDEIEGLRADINELSVELDQRADTLEKTTNDIDELEETVAALETSIDTIREDVDQIHAIEDRVDTVEAAITETVEALDDISDFREQLTTAVTTAFDDNDR